MLQQEEMQKQIVAQIQHQQKLAEMTPEQRLAHQASEWSSNIPVPPTTSAAAQETTQTSTSSTTSSVPTGYPNANGEYTRYRKCFLVSRNEYFVMVSFAAACPSVKLKPMA